MIHEPSTNMFTLTGIVAAILGPILGPYVLIVFGAVVGSLLAMSRTTTATRWEGAKFVGIGVLVALAITGPAIWAVERYSAIPGNVALVPVAFIIGAARNSLLVLIDKAMEAIGTLFASVAGRKGDGQ